MTQHSLTADQLKFWTSEAHKHTTLHATVCGRIDTDEHEHQGNTHHLRLAPGAAIDILHFLVCCMRKEVKISYNPSTLNFNILAAGDL